MKKADLRFVQLFKTYIGDSLSNEERKEFLKYATSEKFKNKLLELIEEELKTQDPKTEGPTSDPDIIWAKIVEEVKARESESVYTPKVHNLKRVWGIAAAILLPAIIMTFIYVNSDKVSHLSTSASGTPVQAEILPGGNKAMLILSDHSEILLDTTKTGIIIKQGSTNILKIGNGTLAYNSASNQNAEILFNTVVTPRGGEYQLQLPDGTRVWLNAASSIKFPTIFTGTQRVVEITGELFFEVAHNTQKPFIVKTNRAEIEVLGTSFNVKTYNEKIAFTTTLVEGSLKLSANANQESIILKPGQLAFLNENGQIGLNDQVDVGSEIAWKNGYFQFKETDLESVMQQISRWYDFEVLYERKQRDIKLTGIVSRKVNASSVFKMLEISGINITVKDNIVIVN